MPNYIKLPQDKQIHQSIKILINVLNHHIERERQLVQLLYKKGITQQDIADYLGITRQGVSIQYPKGGK